MANVIQTIGRHAMLAGLILLVMAPLTKASVAATTGGLDTTFGDGGYVEMGPSYGYWMLARSVIVQDDGKIVAAGTLQRDRGGETSLVAARVESNGALDATFGNGGFVTGTSFGDAGIAGVQQADGKLVVAGRAGDRAAAWRFNRDGTADAGFGTGGTVHLDIDVLNTSMGIVEQVDGRLIMAVSTAGDGGPRLQLIRLNGDGSVDTNFGNGGTADVGSGIVLAMRKDAEGRLLVLSSWASSVAVARAYPDGTLDQTFAHAGTVRIPVPGLEEHTYDGDLTIQDDGRIVAVAHVGTDFWFYSEPEGLVLRLLPDGTLDTSFGDGGQVVTEIERGDSFQGVAVAPGGEIFAGGVYVSTPPPPDQTIAWDFALTQFRTDGTLNTDFGSCGRLVADFSENEMRRYSFADAMAVQPDGRIILAGNVFGGAGAYRMALVRFEVDGSGSASGICVREQRLSVSEDSRFVELHIERVGGGIGESAVGYETMNGRALAGTDYVAANGELVWGDGDTDVKTIRIEIVDDTAAEGLEEFEVRVFAVSGGADVTVSRTLIEIIDDDGSGGLDDSRQSAIPDSVSGGGGIGLAYLLLLLCAAGRRLAHAQKSCVQRA